MIVKKINKNGQGHIEMMLSFVLFLGAVIFIFLYIKPFSNTSANMDELNSVENTIMNHITVDIGRLSIVSFNNSVTNPHFCYNFSETQYGTNYIEVREDSPGTNKLYTIYFGNTDIFYNTISPHREISCIPQNYRLGVFSNQTIISYRKIQQLVYDVNNPLVGYIRVKKNLGINSDFSINTSYLDGTAIPELSFSRSIPGTVEVESKNFPIIAINDTGPVELNMNIKVW